FPTRRSSDLCSPATRLRATPSPVWVQTVRPSCSVGADQVPWAATAAVTAATSPLVATHRVLKSSAAEGAGAAVRVAASRSEAIINEKLLSWGEGETAPARPPVTINLTRKAASIWRAGPGSGDPVLLQRARGADQQHRGQQVEAHARVDRPAQALVAEARGQQVAHPAEKVEADGQAEQVVDQQEQGRGGRAHGRRRE